MRTITYYFKNEDTGELFKIARAFTWETGNHTLKVYYYGFKKENKEYGWIMKDYYHPDFIKGLKEITKKNLDEEKRITAMVYELRK